MKKINILLAGAAAMALAAACSEEPINLSGEGNVMITTTLSSDMKVVARSTDDVDAASYMLWISNDKGLVRKYDGLDNFPSGPVSLLAGSYTAEVWAGDSVSASFDKRWFKGIETFTVTNGATEQVNLTARIANVAVSIDYADDIEDVLDGFTMTVSHDRGSLLYNGREHEGVRGYFMMPSTDKDLKYVLEGTQKNGAPFSFEGVIPNARPATEYRLNVSYSSQPSDKGGAVITIKVDENAIEIEQDVAVIAAPAIEGFDFDLAQTIRGKKGSFGDYMVNIVTAAQIETVELRGSVFEPIIGGPDFKIPGIDESLSAALRAAGFIHERKALQEGESGDRIQLNFAREFMNALPDGSYSITIIATDNEGKASTAVMNITVSDDPLAIEQASAVRYSTATISAAINKAGEGYQLLFRKKGATGWTDAAATETGAYLTAHLTGLDNSTDYEFMAKAADYESAVLTFTTRTPAQLPNAGFEEWGNEGNVLIPGADVSGLFWDTGNHGSMKMGKLVTEKESTLKHSGDFSAALKSQFVGVGALGKFAAGNIFAGKYLETIGTNGKLGWGRDFTEMPSKVRAWVKYTPVAITHVGKGTPDGVNKGDMDRGVIYVALLDDDRSKDKEGWPVVVNTATQEFFKPGEDPRVIAYGEIEFTEATAGDGLVEVTFDIDYRNDKIPAKIVFVAAASKYGDYFTGGAGSTMYLDDIELIYE